MSTEDTRLRLLDPRISTLLRQAQSDDGILRAFARACAQFAVQKAGVTNEALDYVLAQTSDTQWWRSTASATRLGDQVSRIALRFDEQAFAAQEALDNGLGDEDAYTKAFRAARAAFSVVAMLEDSAFSAAVDACYEAIHATNDAETVFDIAQQWLSA